MRLPGVLDTTESTKARALDEQNLVMSSGTNSKSCNSNISVTFAASLRLRRLIKERLSAASLNIGKKLKDALEAMLRIRLFQVYFYFWSSKPRIRINLKCNTGFKAEDLNGGVTVIYEHSLV